MSTVIHTLHVLLAGAWLGGVVFTTFVVSPALGAMKWEEAERVRVRSQIGKQYARVASVNLSLLVLFAVLDGMVGGFGVALGAELVLLVPLLGVVASHGAYFGRRLSGLAAAEREARDEGRARELAERRRALQRVSFRVSALGLLLSVAVAALAVNA